MMKFPTKRPNYMPSEAQRANIVGMASPQRKGEIKSFLDKRVEAVRTRRREKRQSQRKAEDAENLPIDDTGDITAAEPVDVILADPGDTVGRKRKRRAAAQNTLGGSSGTLG